jgi:hypothetical protein
MNRFRTLFNQLFKQHLDKYKKCQDYDVYHAYIMKLTKEQLKKEKANG